MTILKRLLRRPFSSADLHVLAARNIAKPPLLPQMYEAAAGLVGKRGVSLLDYWREGFTVQLEEVAPQKTWQAQRSKLLRLVLAENGWRDVLACTNDIETPEVGASRLRVGILQCFPQGNLEVCSAPTVYNCVAKHGLPDGSGMESLRSD